MGEKQIELFIMNFMRRRTQMAFHSSFGNFVSCWQQSSGGKPQPEMKSIPNISVFLVQKGTSTSHTFRVLLRNDQIIKKVQTKNIIESNRMQTVRIGHNKTQKPTIQTKFSIFISIGFVSIISLAILVMRSCFSLTNNHPTHFVTIVILL